MNATKAIRYDKLKEQLKQEDVISIISCNTCVRLSETGGEIKLEELAKRLRADGFNVRDGFLITRPCDDHYMESVIITPDIDTIIMLSCTSGSANANIFFPDKKVVIALEDRGMAIVGTAKLSDGTTKVRRIWRKTKK